MPRSVRATRISLPKIDKAASIPANRPHQSLGGDGRERDVSFPGLTEAGSFDRRVVSQTGSEDAFSQFLLSVFTISDVAIGFLLMC